MLCVHFTKISVRGIYLSKIYLQAFETFITSNGFRWISWNRRSNTKPLKGFYISFGSLHITCMHILTLPKSPWNTQLPHDDSLKVQITSFIRRRRTVIFGLTLIPRRILSPDPYWISHCLFWKEKNANTLMANVLCLNLRVQRSVKQNHSKGKIQWGQPKIWVSR
jgi:hypothetical protein